MIPTEFLFSQSSLQDYVDCPRRFELRYLERLAWPALISEPVLEVENHMRQGQRLHQLIHQYFLGIPAEILSESIQDDRLSHWWEQFLRAAPLDELPEQRYPEYTLTTPLAGSRIMAKFDLLAFQPGERCLILDWKTFRKQPSRRFLLEKVQTRLYNFILTQAALGLNHGDPFMPEQIEMIYWFPDFPDQPLRFQYSTAQMKTDQIALTEWIGQIKATQSGEFQLTTDHNRCLFCNYRSLCERGSTAGDWNSQEDEITGTDITSGLELDFDQIAEIEF